MSQRPIATPDEHKATAPKAVGCFVLTVSDTKTPETDTGGRTIRELAREKQVLPDADLERALDVRRMTGQA